MLNCIPYTILHSVLESIALESGFIVVTLATEALLAQWRRALESSRFPSLRGPWFSVEFGIPVLGGFRLYRVCGV